MQPQRKVPPKRPLAPEEVLLYADVIAQWRDNEDVRSRFVNLADYANHREDEHFRATGIVRLSDIRFTRAVMAVQQEGDGGSNSPVAKLSFQRPST